jgi:hypothetical protein
MDKVLQERLFNDFPKIFVEKDLPKQQTCMCWGICTDDGWFGLLYKLCEHLQWDTDKNKYPQVIAQQVKEKFGTLRFYYALDCSESVLNEERERSIRKCSEADGAIQFAEAMSGRICEKCGAFDDTVQLMVRGGWYKTLCTVCAEPIDYRPAKPYNSIENNLVSIMTPILED